MRRHRGTKIGEWFLPASIFFSVWPSTRRRGQSCCRFFCARLAPADGARVARRRLHFTKKEFSLTAGLRLKVREGHSNESNALRRWEHGTDQVEGDFMQPMPCLDRRFHRSATSRQLKVGPFDLHRDGPAMSVRLLAPGPDIVGHRNHSRLDLNGISQVFWKSRLRSRRLSFAVRLDQPVVPTSRDVVVPAPRLAEVLLQKRKSLPSQVRARLDAKGAHLNGHLWAHAVELRDR